MTDPIRDQLQAALGSAYTIERQLGAARVSAARGAVGGSRAFVARDEALGRLVAVKVLPPGLARGLNAERLAREIQLAAALQEPHIVGVHAAGVMHDPGTEAPEGVPYYIMPFIRGESLRARLAEGRLPLLDALGMLRNVAQALAYAHAHGVVHRYIKPENILLSLGTAMVTDFGIAKAVADSRGAATSMDLGTASASSAEAGTTLGTPGYMAPEQATGDAVDPRADLYAWGVVAYESLSGRHPFGAGAAAQPLTAAQATATPAPLGSVARDVPRALAALVMRCLAKRPDDRPASADAIVAALGDATLLVTPREVDDDSDDEPPSRRPSRRFRIVLAAASLAAVIVIVLLVRLWSRVAERARAAGPSAVMTTVAVLPFANTGGRVEDEYLSDGITDELAHALSRLPALRVAGRTSSYAYKGKPVREVDVGRALGVAGVIVGTVQHVGSRLRVTARLTSAVDGVVVWSGSYESRATDVFQVQDEVTRHIVGAIAPALGGTVAPSAARASRGTMDAEAFDLYLRGVYFWNERRAESLARAADYLSRAVARDSTFARAYARLALVHAVAPNLGLPVSRDSSLTLTRADAARALALDPRLAEPHLALGTALNRLGRFAEAEQEFVAGLALGPDDAQGHAWHGRNLAAVGRTDESIREHRQSVAIDPLSATFHEELSAALLNARQFPEALTVARRAVELDTADVAARQALASALVFSGMPDSAIAVRRGPRGGPIDARLVLAYAAAGRRKEAEALRDTLVLRAQTGPRGPGADTLRARADAAVAGFVLGDPTALLAMLDGGPSERGLAVRFDDLACDPLFDPLKADPRFGVAMARLGFRMCPATTPWPVPARPRP